MIIDDAGIHHGDWPLISINADQDVTISNWRDRNDVDGVYMQVYKCVCCTDVDVGYLVINATIGEMYSLRISQMI